MYTKNDEFVGNNVLTGCQSARAFGWWGWWDRIIVDKIIVYWIFYLPMLSKVFKSMFSTAPNVWVNKYTKVICQGITGNQVLLAPFREPSRLNKPLTTARRWSEESTQRKPAPLTSASLSSRTASKPRSQPAATHQSSMSLPPAQLMQLLRPLRLSSTSLSSSLTVLPPLFRHPSA